MSGAESSSSSSSSESDSCEEETGKKEGGEEEEGEDDDDGSSDNDDDDDGSSTSGSTSAATDLDLGPGLAPLRTLLNGVGEPPAELQRAHDCLLAALHALGRFDSDDDELTSPAPVTIPPPADFDWSRSRLPPPPAWKGTATDPAQALQAYAAFRFLGLGDDKKKEKGQEDKETRAALRALATVRVWGGRERVLRLLERSRGTYTCTREGLTSHHLHHHCP